MAISANKLKTVRQRRMFSPWELGMLSDDGTSVFVAETAAADLGEFASLGIAYPLVDEGEILNGLLYIPSDADRDNDLRFRIGYMSTSTTDADIFLFLFEYMSIQVNHATDTPLVQSGIVTALDTIIPSDTKGTGVANAINFTEPGILNGGTILEDDRYLNISITVTTATTGALAFIGVEMEYTPKWYKGHIGQAPAWQNKN